MSVASSTSRVPTSVSSSITQDCKRSWKRICMFYQQYILPEYRKPLLYIFLGVWVLLFWRLVFKTSPVEMVRWLDVEYYLENEDGTPYGYVYFPLGTILLFIGVVTMFSKLANRLQALSTLHVRHSS
eukprot:jgi/Galph1/1133/GphlegSOOS_G5874.1